MLYLETNVGNNAQWLLCYRASTHGWESSTFHERCDGKPNTVTIVKVGDFVFGGYTDIPWGKFCLDTTLTLATNIYALYGERSGARGRNSPLFARLCLTD